MKVVQRSDDLKAELFASDPATYADPAGTLTAAEITVEYDKEVKLRHIKLWQIKYQISQD